MSTVDELAGRRKGFGKFTPVEDLCYECKCGSQVFILRPDAKVECGFCEHVDERLLWGERFLPSDADPPPAAA